MSCRIAVSNAERDFDEVRFRLRRFRGGMAEKIEERKQGKHTLTIPNHKLLGT
jgi:hypothetical protein